MGELKLLPCSHSDAAEILEGQFAAFSDPHEEFFFCLFPKEEDREVAVKRVVELWVEDESARYMKVVDVESGAIVSAAKWCIYGEPLTEEQMHETLHVNWHSDPETNEWTEHLIHFIHSHRLKRTKGGRCCVLDMITTHPAHQHRGAGSMLVKWGTEIADSMGVECFIEGTAIAKRLYESCGFATVPKEMINIPVPEKFMDKPVIQYYFYERPAKTEKVTEDNGETV